MTEPSIAVGTIVTRSHLAFARVLVASLGRFHPSLPCFVLVVDGAGSGVTETGCELLGLADLELPCESTFGFRQTRESAVCAVKPWLLAALLRRFASAIVLDADMFVLASLEPLLVEVAQRPLVLTPHLLSPVAGPRAAAHELAILRAGTFNGGIVGVSRSPTTDAFLGWWRDRLATHCRLDLAAGLHYDQRWLDLVPGFFAEVAICRDPGVNVAHSNLHERPLTVVGECLLAAGQPCRLFHFSGFDPQRPDVLSRHASPRAAEEAPVAALRDRYAELLAAAGHHEATGEPYGFDVFDNGVRIPDVARELHAELGEAAASFGNPFETARHDSFWHWLLTPAVPPADGLPAVSRLWLGVHRSRHDLQLAFPALLAADREAFLAWAVAHGVREHGVAAELARWDEPATRAVGPDRRCHCSSPRPQHVDTLGRWREAPRSNPTRLSPTSGGSSSKWSTMTWRGFSPPKQGRRGWPSPSACCA